MKNRKMKWYWLKFLNWLSPKVIERQELKDEAYAKISNLSAVYSKKQIISIIKLMIKELELRNANDIERLTKELDDENKLTELIKTI